MTRGDGEMMEINHLTLKNKSLNVWRYENFFVSLQQNKNLQSYGKM